MYHGAVSTDIKKSSILWANLNTWMSEAVERTNNMTEFVFQSMTKEGIKQVQLPNSPEGDAYTFYFKGEDQQALKNHVKKVAHALQEMYKMAREKGLLTLSQDEVRKIIGDRYNKRIEEVEEDDEKIKIETLENEKKRKIDFILSEEFYYGIFVRIGVAFDNIPPVEYKYKVHLPDTKGIIVPGRTWKIYKSYTSGVIKESERAEEQAKYKDAIAITQRGEKVKNEDTTAENSLYLIKEIDVKEMVIKKAELEKDPINRMSLAPTKVNVNGYMIFIHYHLHITMEKVEEDPHLYSQMVDEFREIHAQTVDTLERLLGYDQVYLVKVKRSTDSMIYIKAEKAPSTIWNTCLSLCAALPTGSSIGICFTRPNSGRETGKLKRVTYKHNDGMDRVDYFGDCVNLSARMDTFDWEYDTGLFKVEKNDHKNRVAMACAETTSKGWYGWGTIPGKSSSIKSFNRPFKIEDIPRDALNAGSANQFLRAITAHVYLGDTIREGDVVEWCDGTRQACKEPYGTDFHVARVISVDFLRITVREMKYIDNQWKDVQNSLVTKNITYVKKRKAEPLKPVADKLEKNDVLKGSFSQLKF